MKFDILSLFPEYFQGPLDVSILKRARERGLLSVSHTNIRDFATGKHNRVDDRPFGGGPGMLLMAEPVTKAIRHVRRENSHVVYLSPQGKPFNAAKAKELATREHLVLLCGHYEGIDARVKFDEEISIGDYVLTNGCLPALVLIDSISRFIPKVLGHEEAAACDSFENGIFDAPHYTQPVDFEGEIVPEVLRSGNHKAIKAWRHEQALKKTALVRPDLVEIE